MKGEETERGTIMIKNRMKKRVFEITKVIAAAAIASFVMIGSLCGCSDDQKDTADSTPAETETTAAQEAAPVDDAWKDAYRQVLEEKQGEIEAYTRQEDSSDASHEDEPAESKQVAWYDINNDQIPELFFFTEGMHDENEAALLNIYTFMDGKAQRLEYPCMTTTGEVTEDGFYDEIVSAGVPYAVVSFKDHSGFAIYFHVTYDIAVEGRAVAYEYDGDSIEMTKRLRYEQIMRGEPEDGVDEEMFIDDQQVAKEEYDDALQDLYQKSDALIMRSSDYYDKSLWDYVDGDELLSMPYVEAVKALSE